MTRWVWEGLRNGIRTTRYPAAAERAAGVSPGRPAARAGEEARARAGKTDCPTDAIGPAENGSRVDYRRCVHCFACARDAPAAVDWEEGYEWAGAQAEMRRLGRRFRRSLNVRFLDAGACGACMGEVRQIDNPYYNMHRLGFFLTPTPRNADVLLVAGPVTAAMRGALRATYEAMPPPKRVVAMGVCALSGGVFGPSAAAEGGVAAVVPVDVTIPGCPPPPLAILHGLLVAVGRKPPAPLESVPEDSSP
ncbi:MAG TPA: NADH:ubiquinone oxidoreductase [Acetobacteraceae bacterium]|nr:NADH:ubiquinone oxidoreductase [Acetobacteraceae bacterium]